MPVHIQQTDNTGRGTILEDTLQMSNNDITGVNRILLNTLFTPNGEVAGTLYYNQDEDSLDFVSASGAIANIPQELWFDGKNQTGSLITDGTPVMFAGTLGASGRTLIQKGIADYSLQSSYIMGITTQDISNGSDGKVTWFGKVRGINTTGTLYGETWSDGNILYLSQTTAGYLTNERPTSGQVIEVAAVVHAANNGTLLVRPTWFDKDNKSLTKTSDYTIDGTEADGELVLLVDASSNDVDITLPAASVIANRFVNIKRIDNSNNLLTIIGTVDGQVNPQIQYQNTSIRIVSDSTNYYYV